MADETNESSVPGNAFKRNLVCMVIIDSSLSNSCHQTATKQRVLWTCLKANGLKCRKV